MLLESEALAVLRKSDPRKVLVAAIVRKNTSVSNRWLTDRLAMGHAAGVSRVEPSPSECREVKENVRKLAELEEMLRCGTWYQTTAPQTTSQTSEP